MRSGDRGNFVPHDAPGSHGGSLLTADKWQVFGTLRIKMDPAMVIAREALEQLCESAFGAVMAVHERRNEGQPQGQGVPGRLD